MTMKIVWFALVAAGVTLQVSNTYAEQSVAEGKIDITANIVATSCELDSDDGNLFVALKSISNTEINGATEAGYEFKDINKSFTFKCSADRAKLTSVPLSSSCQTANGPYSCGLKNPTVGVMPVLSVGSGKIINLKGEIVTGEIDIVDGKATLSLESVYAAKLSDDTPVSPGDVSVDYQISVWNF